MKLELWNTCTPELQERMVTEHMARSKKQQTVPGVKHDQEKDDWSILPLKVLRGPIRALMHGEEKYERDNYQHVEPPRRYWSALMRHMAEYDAGEELDSDSNLSHLWHMGACIIFLLWFQMYKGFSPKSLKEKKKK